VREAYYRVFDLVANLGDHGALFDSELPSVNQGLEALQ